MFLELVLQCFEKMYTGFLQNKYNKLSVKILFTTASVLEDIPLASFEYKGTLNNAEIWL